MLRIRNRTKRSVGVHVALSAIMAALVCMTTMLIQVPNPPTQGYINLGDAMIFIAAITFGPIIGGFAGGIGSALADVLLGYPHFAVFTLVIKGIEGVIAGIVSRRIEKYGAAIGSVAGGSEMVIGYFIVEYYLWGLGAAVTEIPGNLSQVIAGTLIGVPISHIIKRRLPLFLQT